MCAKIRIELNKKLYLKDPEHTHLGWKIITEGIRMIDELGFEQFTFKKLATAIQSTEASVYRYFESKHKLLIYLISWYWVLIDYQINFKTNNINDPRERLKIILLIIAQSAKDDPYFSHIDQAALHRIVIAESSKAYLTKDVEALNKDGLYLEYQNLCKKIAGVVSEINPHYLYPHALVTTVFEAAHQQIFFSRFLQSLTEVKVDKDFTGVTDFLENLVFSTIGAK